MANFLFLVFGIYLMLLTFDKAAATDHLEANHEITRDECINGANYAPVGKNCCHTQDLDDDASRTCWRNLYSETQSVAEEFVLFSIIVECIYKKRNYIKSNNHLNMAIIKAEAKRLYGKDSAQKNYMIDMYKTCARDATKKLELTKNTPKSNELLKGTHQPYFTFVYLCGVSYSQMKCPYFRWKPVSASYEKFCTHYAQQCKQQYFKNTNMYLRRIKNIQAAR